jgi:hypothetical protein
MLDRAMANPLSLSTKIACNRGKRRMVRDEGGEEVENGIEGEIIKLASCKLH